MFAGISKYSRYQMPEFRLFGEKFQNNLLKIWIDAETRKKYFLSRLFLKNLRVFLLNCSSLPIIHPLETGDWAENGDWDVADSWSSHSEVAECRLLSPAAQPFGEVSHRMSAGETFVGDAASGFFSILSDGSRSSCSSALKIYVCSNSKSERIFINF